LVPGEAEARLDRCGICAAYDAQQGQLEEQSRPQELGAILAYGAEHDLVEVERLVESLEGLFAHGHRGEYAAPAAHEACFQPHGLEAIEDRVLSAISGFLPHAFLSLPKRAIPSVYSASLRVALKPLRAG
jgi:hypothetical protein